MSDTIEPALTAEEWKLWRFEPLSAPGLIVHDDGDGIEFVTRNDAGELLGKYKLEHWQPADHAGVIALLNHGLPESDPRKITRKHVSDLKNVAMLARDALKPYGDLATWGRVPRTLDAMIDRIEAFAFSLDSYLPPETDT